MPESYPPPVPKMCSDCPWRRDKAIPGHLGPHTAREWVRIAHSDRAVACHQTIRVEEGESEGSWDDPKMRQCRGIASFRANVGKNPRNPQIEAGPKDHCAFEDNDEFTDYHGGERLDSHDLYGPMDGEEKE